MARVTTTITPADDNWVCLYSATVVGRAGISDGDPAREVSLAHHTASTADVRVIVCGPGHRVLPLASGTPAADAQGWPLTVGSVKTWHGLVNGQGTITQVWARREGAGAKVGFEVGW